MGSQSLVLSSPAPSPAATAAESTSEHDGSFDWWMPGASTAAKVGVFASILVALVLVVLAMRLVLRRWRQQREADDPEMLGTTALKELFFSHKAPSSSSLKGAGSGRMPSPTVHSNLSQIPYSDGNVWLKEQGRRQQRTRLLTEVTQPATAEKNNPATSVAAPGGAVQLAACEQPGAGANPLRESGNLSQADSTVGLLMHTKEAANHDKDDTLSSTPSPAIHAALTVGHRRIGSSSSPLQSEHTDGAAACLSPMPSEDVESPAGVQAAGSGQQAAVGLGVEVLPGPPHHVVAMQQVMGRMCPGVPAIEQRLQAVLQEALHGQCGAGPGSQGPLLAPTLSSSSTGGVPAGIPAAGAAPMQSVPTMSSGGLGSGSGSGVAIVSNLSLSQAASGGPGSGAGTASMAGHAGPYGSWRGGRASVARDILTGMLNPRDFMLAQQQQQQQQSVHLAHRASMPVPEHVLQYAVPGPPSQGRIPHARTHTWTEISSMHRQEHSTLPSSNAVHAALAVPIAGAGRASGQQEEATPAQVHSPLPRPPPQSVFSSVPAQAATSAALEACPQQHDAPVAVAASTPAAHADVSAVARSSSHASALDKALSRMAAAPLPRPRSVMAVSKAAAGTVNSSMSGSAAASAGALQKHASDAYQEQLRHANDMQQEHQGGDIATVQLQHAQTAQHHVTIGGTIPGSQASPMHDGMQLGTDAQARQGPQPPKLGAVRVASEENWTARGSPLGSRVVAPTVHGTTAQSPFHPSHGSVMPSTPTIDPLDDSPFNDTSHQLAQLSHFQAYIQGADLPIAQQQGLGPVRLESYEPLPNAASPGPSYITPADSVSQQGSVPVRYSSGGLSSQFSFVYQPRPTVGPAGPRNGPSPQMINNEAAEHSDRSTMSPQFSIQGMLDMQGTPLEQPAAHSGK